MAQLIEKMGDMTIGLGLHMEECRQLILCPVLSPIQGKRNIASWFRRLFSQGIANKVDTDDLIFRISRLTFVVPLVSHGTLRGEQARPT